jgi:hypothetical protein
VHIWTVELQLREIEHCIAVWAAFPIHVDGDKNLNDYFFVENVCTKGFVVMPSGFGTLDELFKTMTLIQTKDP